MRLTAVATLLALAVSPERPVHWSARATPASVRAGDTVRVALHASIDEFFHLYSTTQGPGGPVRTTIEVVGKEWTQVGKLRAPAPDTIPDGNFGIMSEVYDDSVTIGMTLRPVASAANAPRVAIHFQACTTRYCLPARTDTVIVRGIELQNVAQSTAAPQAAAIAPDEPPIQSFGDPGGLGAFLLLAATMGALALLTPCVFPMIPITVTSFIATSDDRKRGIRQAAMYALGIVASFTVLGLATAALFGASGLARFSAHPVVNLAIAALFAFFALSLLGVTRLSLPSSFVARVASLRPRSTVLMGVVFTLTAFTCTAPFVGSLLVMSSQGNWRWPLAGILVFSCVFAAPFFLLALIPGVLERRPRAGEWMPAIEIALGAIELGAAIKFVSNADLVLGWGVFTRQVVVTLWMVILATLVFALIRRRGRIRLVLAAITVGGVALLAPGLFGRRLGELEAFLPPAQTQATRGELAWTMNDLPAALRIAAREQRPILIDFTGYTCTNCRWMEANMFPRDDVRQALDRFVRVRLYTDGLGEPYTAHQLMEQRMFGTVALPLYAVLDPAGQPRARYLGMTRDAAEFVAFLDRSYR